MALVALLAACQGPYYAPCERDPECGALLQCAHVLGIDSFCTGSCSSSEDCTERFGDGSYCGLRGVCFEACERDADCPHGAECQPDRFCAHRTEAP